MKGTSSTTDLRRRRLKRLMVGSTAAALGLLAVLRFADLSSRSERILANGDRRALNLAHILSRYLGEAFAASDASLRQLAALNPRIGGPLAPDQEWLPLLSAARAGLTGIGSMSVIDRTGIVRHSTRREIVGQSRRDDYVFRQLASDSVVGLVASTPFRAIYRPDQALVIPLGRRLTTAGGAFDGGIVATFVPDSLREFFRTIDVGEGGTVTVFHADGFVVFREPSVRNPIGESAVGDPLLDVGRHAGRGSLRTKASPGRSALRNGVLSLPGLSLIVAVSLSEPELLATVQRDALISAIVLAMLAASAATGLLALFRQMDRRAAMESAMNRAQHLEVLGRLTGGVAHDFNNLLAVIQGYASLIRIDAASPTRDLDQEALDEIRAAATRAAGLTNQLLAFARRQPLQPRLVDLSQVIRGMEPLLIRTIGEDVTLRLNLGATCFSLVDPVQLDTAILNLVVNARHAMANGGLLLIETGQVRLDANYAKETPDAAPGEYCFVSVADTGVGIPAELLPRLFEPFFTTRLRGEGTGLGLSMVYGFVRQSGGHVKVYSEVGQGTTIKLYFPSAQDQWEEEPPASLAGETPRGSGELVLLVEDEKALRNIATRMLKALGYRVTAAGDGPSALELAKREARIDLLFTDVVLPGPMTGLALAAELTRMRPNLAVLFTSGYSEEVIQHRTSATEDLHLLPKPYDSHRLGRAVHESLRSVG
ncbi:MAG: ATP-binding protein [Gemmatimonadaceae bacterium]